MISYYICIICLITTISNLHILSTMTCRLFNTFSSLYGSQLRCNHKRWRYYLRIINSIVCITCIVHSW